MNKQAIHTETAPQAIGPYSQALKVGEFIYTSGQLGMDASGALAAGPAEQAKLALNNVAAILSAAGSSMDKVIKCTVFITNMADFAAINAVYEQFFSAPFPARSCVQVAALPKGGQVEIEAIAQA